MASLVFSVGYISLGIAIAWAGVLPRGVVLLAFGRSVVAFAAPTGVQVVIALGHALFGLGPMWLGYALWSTTGREQPSGV
ncbi:MAG TPA: hypothetical protein VK276_00525 [Rubrobacteraceae bacterium]|nr:hypothetical protein [Rubrobacteraceae bacterium]